MSCINNPVWHLFLWNLLKLRLWLGCLLLRDITLKDLLWIILGVTSSSSIIVSIIVGAGVGVTIVLVLHLCRLLCNEVIAVHGHLLLLIIVLMELLDLVHSLSWSMIHSDSQEHLLSQPSVTPGFEAKTRCSSYVCP
jgi:hypothetical protein